MWPDDDDTCVGGTILTVEQLDALPKGAVLARVHSDGSGPTVYVNEPRMGWLMATEQIGPPSVSDRDTVGNRLGRLTVLYVPGESSRPSVTDNARAEAMRRYPSDIADRGLTYPTGAVREHSRAAFVAGAEWAAGRVETTTATTEDAALVIHETQCVEDEHGDHCIFWEEDHQSAQALADAGLLATARTRPTRYEVARAIRLSRTNGLCKPGVRCDLCDCAQEYEDDLALRDADAVLALLRGGERRG